ncbi:glycosyltransferase [Porticoccaceae bacterium]|nr:glycosyltransferase [Porticoccaceae bacterium]
MKLSVLLASYNGERFIAEQISSILDQLLSEDQLIISDDGSTDRTREIVSSFNDARMTILEGPREGINANFINAYEHASGDAVLFSDQDDIWLPGRAQLYRDRLVLYDFVICDAEIIDEQGQMLDRSYFQKNRTPKTFFGNSLRCRTLGCCIGFRREVIGEQLNIYRDYDTLPFDYSLTLLSLFYFKVYFSKEPYHQYRRHNTNYSAGGEKSKSTFWRMATFRIRVLIYVLGAKRWLPPHN